MTDKKWCEKARRASVSPYSSAVALRRYLRCAIAELEAKEAEIAELKSWNEYRRGAIEDWQKVSGDDCPGELEYTLKKLKAEIEKRRVSAKKVAELDTMTIACASLRSELEAKEAEIVGLQCNLATMRDSLNSHHRRQEQLHAQLKRLEEIGT